MKSTILLFLMIISIITTILSGIWICVEFILFLAKDNPFNWLSVFVYAAGVVLAITFRLTHVATVLKQMDAKTESPVIRTGFNQCLSDLSKSK